MQTTRQQRRQAQIGRQRQALATWWREHAQFAIGNTKTAATTKAKMNRTARRALCEINLMLNWCQESDFLMLWRDASQLNASPCLRSRSTAYELDVEKTPLHATINMPHTFI